MLCNDCHVKANADDLIALPQEGNKMVPAPQAQPKDVRNVLDNLAKAIEKGASTIPSRLVWNKRRPKKKG